MRALVLLAALVLAAPAAAADRGTLTAGNSRYGTILFDGRGFVLYAFTKDAKGRSACSGACAAAWPPYLASRPAAGKGTKGALLGTTRRADGKLQVTYAGRPLYYYVGDRSPGQILCQNVAEYGGLWLVLRRDGSLVR
jgi:predicted lipoprotein with Yx(FWY)xxD motif